MPAFKISYVTDECYGQSLPKWWHLPPPSPPAPPPSILHCPPFKSHQVMLGSFCQKFSAAGHFQSSVRFCHGDMIIFDESKSCSYLKAGGLGWVGRGGGGYLLCVKQHPLLFTCVATIRGKLHCMGGNNQLCWFASLFICHLAHTIHICNVHIEQILTIILL